MKCTQSASKNEIKKFACHILFLSNAFVMMCKVLIFIEINRMHVLKQNISLIGNHVSAEFREREKRSLC